jgi:hypothetical protein
MPLFQIPVDPARAAAILTTHTGDPASRRLQRLAWCALKSARGQPVRQSVLPAPICFAERRAQMRATMLAEGRS